MLYNIKKKTANIKQLNKNIFTFLHKNNVPLFGTTHIYVLNVFLPCRETVSIF